MEGNAQIPSCVVMIRPHNFCPNPETAEDNKFQGTIGNPKRKLVAKAAYDDVTRAADLLKNEGIRVVLFEDSSSKTPDSCYPNNWFSTHPDGSIVLYPMYAPNRRLERRVDIIEKLKSEYEISAVIDKSPLERKGVFLEGTGSIVLDHIDRIAYAAQSNRTNADAFKSWCKEMRYQAVLFKAQDTDGAPIYHTNVMMGIGTDVAVIGLDSIKDSDERENVMSSLVGSNRNGRKRELIELTSQQVESFAGNMLEVMGKSGPLLILSTTAFKSLHQDQISKLEKFVKLFPIDVPAIELGGGSIRCMMAGIHLPEKYDAEDEKCYIKGIN